MAFALPPASQPVLAIEGTDDSFPVRRIYCVGRNYAAHAREMGFDPEFGTPPFFFMKPADAIVPSGARIPYPRKSDDVHHEVELVVAIGKAGRDITVEAAADHVFGYAVGIDLTRRDPAAAGARQGPAVGHGQGGSTNRPPAPALVPADPDGLADAAIWPDHQR